MSYYEPDFGFMNQSGIILHYEARIRAYQLQYGLSFDLSKGLLCKYQHREAVCDQL